MTSSCSIVFFENPEGVYSPGQILSGRVNLVTKKVKAIKGMRFFVVISCGGKGNISPSKSARYGSKSKEI